MSAKDDSSTESEESIFKKLELHAKKKVVEKNESSSDDDDFLKRGVLDSRKENKKKKRNNTHGNSILQGSFCFQTIQWEMVSHITRERCCCFSSNCQNKKSANQIVCEIAENIGYV